MISADAKPDVKQQQLEDCVLKPFTEVSSQIFKYNVKQAITLHLILIGIPSRLILSVKNGGGDDHLTYKIIICWQSLILKFLKSYLR